MKADRRKVELIMAKKMLRRSELEAAGVPLGTFNRALNGAEMRPITLGAFARALGVEVEEILKEE